MKKIINKETDLFGDLEATIKCENPTANLYKFHGRIEYDAKTSNYLRESIIIHDRGESFLTPNPRENNYIIDTNNWENGKKKTILFIIIN